ncbi:hypothetical protein O6H91_15G033600 [Diphasiastrum complanatum]|uniref:Uncharacterized protein n=2 Tax=Diphasiastrum complanatum TaxID=34168 RepID=A0ACC2BH88_DIPCM|nr:hypothetical protein O6H91_15G033600 [Diphasiastrum complanatum]KAJ7529087.1 hypothetical protein O6H91_15G033600 [Diphasiastrum complanatum]
MPVYAEEAEKDLPAWTGEREDAGCSQVPSLVSAFVDTFVDFVVGGQFLSPSSDFPSTASSEPTRATGGAFEEEDDQTLHSYRGLATQLPAAERLVAIGDIHGDLEKAKEALRIADLIDSKDHWIGGKTVVVQVGDLLDRGGQELKVIYLLERLKSEAKQAGGDVHIMNGNHEIMNMEGDFRFVTKEGMEEFKNWAHWYNMGEVMKGRCQGLQKQPDPFWSIPKEYSEAARARLAALGPGGPIATRFLAQHPMVLMVGGNVFVHGGLLPSHVHHGLERLNWEVREWMMGKRGRRAPSYLHGKDALVWVRRYSLPKESTCECDLLKQSLGAIGGAERMVVGHTIQEKLGINGACSNQVIRIDVGMSRGCDNASPEVLEIRNDSELRVLSSNASPQVIGDRKPLWNKDKPGLASLLT